MQAVINFVPHPNSEPAKSPSKKSPVSSTNKKYNNSDSNKNYKHSKHKPTPTTSPAFIKNSTNSTKKIHNYGQN